MDGWRKGNSDDSGGDEVSVGDGGNGGGNGEDEGVRVVLREHTYLPSNLATNRQSYR